MTDPISPTCGTATKGATQVHLPVVVGVDGSGWSVRALAWAAEEARLRGRPLHIVCVLPAGRHECGALDAESVLGRARTIARMNDPHGRVSTEVRRGVPATVLAELSTCADLLVLGHRGGDGVVGPVFDSTAHTLARTTAGPLVVVRAAPGRPVPDRDRPVVVGVDESPDSRAAIEFAVHLADRRGSELVAVHVWSEHPSQAVRRLTRRELEPGREAADRLLAECIAGHAAHHPGLQVRREVVSGRPAWALLELSDSAQLVVVGGRGRTGLARLGSCAEVLVQASTCPVAIVRPQPVRWTGSDGSVSTDCSSGIVDR